MRNPWIPLATFLGALGVILGAFGAHGLKDKISFDSFQIFQTASHYHLFHVLALLAFGIWSEKYPAKINCWIGLFFSLGIFIFSGSLYVLSVSGISILGAITPFGGVFLITAWLLWTRAALQSQKIK